MIISCEKCDKKFEISDNLIPNEGRLLQCGSCSHRWHYTPENSLELLNEVDEIKKPIKIKKPPFIKKNKNIKININDDENESFSPNHLTKKSSKSIGFLSKLLVVIISFIGLIIIADTFKSYLSSYIPGIDFYLSSLYESLKDIFLFFSDLIK